MVTIFVSNPPCLYPGREQDGQVDGGEVLRNACS